jgi:alanine-synthesizing transaminase
MRKYLKSAKLANVCYDIRGPVLSEAKRLEEEGYNILKLNIGNPATFGLNAPDEIIHDVIMNLPQAQGYCDSQGLFSARKAVMQEYQKKGFLGVQMDHIYIGNGVSELISMSLNALLNNGDEVLVPAPDYPLWTASVTLSGGKAVHYLCDESSSWIPDLEDIKKKITAKTVGLVIINPNNPTGAVYPRETVEALVKIASEHNLIVFSDEIYEKIIYDNIDFTAPAEYCEDVLCLTFNGLSKAYRAAGFRTGWMLLSGKISLAEDYIEGLNILSNMRLCSNVPSQFAIQTALGGYQSISDLVNPGGRLLEQRDLAWELLSAIPGISCVKPAGALYLFPKLDIKRFNIKDDRKFVFDLLVEKKILTVQGTGFNWPDPDHFRIVFLPQNEILKEAMQGIAEFLENYSQVG